MDGVSDDFLATARKRFAQAELEERGLREEAEKDLRFVAGDQWDAALKADREKAKRPCLTFARCHTFVQQVSNEARQQKPQIKFVPENEDDKDTAEVNEGLARHIQYDSDAQVAYETAVEYSAGGGFGYYRFLTDYCDDETFDQDLKVTPVFDPFSVYGILMPSILGQEPRFGFVVEHLTKEEYKALYPKSELATMDWATAYVSAENWVEDDRVRIAEYWYIEETPKELKQKRSDRTRTVMQKTVKFCKINGVEVLEGTETEWLDYCIPIFPVLGKQMIVAGKPYLHSVVRHQRDPQRLINYYKTRIAETLGDAPIQPYLVSAGQIKGFEREWAELNTGRRPFLQYNAEDIVGKPTPPPIRNVYEPPIGSLSAASAQEIDDMKATTGIYDASLGNQGNEQSGIAIQKRQQQSDVINAHILDNLSRSFSKSGRAISRLMPKIYDGARQVKILGEDEQPKIVKINAKTKKGDKDMTYKVGGDYAIKSHVVVTMGRAFSTKRAESFDLMQTIVQAAPETLNIIGDIMFRNSDVAGADQLAERFQKMLPPQLQDKKEGAPEIPPEVQQKLAESQQMIAELTQELHAASAEAEKRSAEIASKERIAAANNETTLAVNEMKLESAGALATLQAELKAVHAMVAQMFAPQQEAQPEAAEPQEAPLQQ